MEQPFYSAAAQDSENGREHSGSRSSRSQPSGFRPAAGVLISDGDRVLLIRRGADPGRGRWDVPGGFLEPGETAAAAARREIREELGLELGPLDLLLSDVNPLPEATVLDLIFVARHNGKEPRAGSDAAEYRWFHRDQLPEQLAFPTTHRILQRWRQLRPGDGYRLLGGAPLPLAEAETITALAGPWMELPDQWQAEGGQWRIHEGALCGSISGEHSAAFWYRQELAGDHAILFTASTVPPRSNDLNCYWEGNGSLQSGFGGSEPNCTIGGVGGWWDGLSGIERYPEGGVRVTGRLQAVEAGRIYEVCAGRWGDLDFLFIDGRLAVQLDEPGASRRPRSRVALATWDSHVHFHSVRVFRLPAPGQP